MSIEADAGQWAQRMFGHCELSDARCTDRLVHTMRLLAQHGGGSISQACAKDAAAMQGGYRLLRNSKMSVQAMSEAGFAATVQQLVRGRRTLAIEDSSVLTYSHSVAEELGDTGGREESQNKGLWSHNTLLVDADSGMTHGLVAQTLWCRDQQPRGKRHQRHEKLPQEKESFKWSLHAQQMRERLGEHRDEVITVSDRESDVFAYLWDKHQHRERFIVRAAQDRALVDSDERLFETVLTSSVRGQMQVSVPQRGGRVAREATLSLRAAAVVLKAPPRQGIDAQAQVPVNAILAEELDVDPAKALCWLLLTSEPIQTPQQLQEALRFYAMRWRIEEFHKAWKSGAQVEQMRMQSKETLERMVVMLAFVAVRLLQLRETLDHAEAAALPCTQVLSDTEWKVLWVSSAKKPTAYPKSAPTLRWAYQSVAKLGGFYDSKRTGRASWAAMYEGWMRLQDQVRVATALQHQPL